MEATRKNICGNPGNKITRVSIPESIKLYPLEQNGQVYGAILVGDHYFYQNGNIKKAVDILNNNRFPKELKTEQFLEAFNSPDVWIKFQMIYDLNDKDNCRNRRFELFQFSEMLYWVSHLIVSNETYSLMTYQAVTPEDANDSFNQIIP